jgi:acid phosphatase type 7
MHAMFPSQGHLGRVLLAGALVAAAVALVAPSASGGRLAATAGARVADPVIAAAGDVACDPTDPSYNGGKGTSTHCRQLATSNLVLANPGISQALVVGDSQDYCGGLRAYQAAFAPSWGRFLSKIRPVPGNHDYWTSGGTDCAQHAAGFFTYYGAAAGDSRGDHAWNVGSWHIIALNGNCSEVGGCGATSAQGKWLTAHLGSSRCTLAYWHQPYYTGAATPVAAYKPFWQILLAAHADVVLAGHVHTYARFAPQNASGAVDRAHGMREFIVGTGGDSIGGPLGSTNIEANKRSFGILELTLHPASYDWRFVTVDGVTADSGTAACS